MYPPAVGTLGFLWLKILRLRSLARSRGSSGWSYRATDARVRSFSPAKSSEFFAAVYGTAVALAGGDRR